MLDNRILSTLFWFGRLVSPLYSLAMRIRAVLYAEGLFRSSRMPLPVVSVGNLTMGGTGKTPMVIYLARLLASHRRPGIVSRGYRGRSRQPVNLVSDGVSVLMTAEEAGDEPVLLARSLPGVPVVTARQRVMGSEFLVRQALVDVLILDDGFQHLALKRDLDIVLFSAHTSMDTAWVFPGGMLRESPSALGRADCFVLTAAEQGTKEETVCLQGWLQKHFPLTPVFVGRYQPVGLYCRERGRAGLDTLQGLPLFGFCGIARPQSFQETLHSHFQVKGFRAFADHHPFAGDDLKAICEQAVAAGAEALITTEKDFVKIKDASLPLPLWVLAVELQIEHGFDSFVVERLVVLGQ